LRARDLLAENPQLGFRLGEALPKDGRPPGDLGCGEALGNVLRDFFRKWNFVVESQSVECRHRFLR
jgi:hypothetical protein